MVGLSGKLTLQGRRRAPYRPNRLFKIGSAACATAVAAARLRRANRVVQISLPGGELEIEWREGDDHVLLTGTAAFEYEGRFDTGLFASIA
jgi:diaminopimelate epimerase